MSRLAIPPENELFPQPVPRDFIDCEFAKPHGVSLEVRIWPALAGSPNRKPTSNTHPTAGEPSARPWLLWFHGGGYSGGTHFAIPSWVVPGFRSRGFHVVSAAYRFVPQVHFEEQLEDLTAAHTWCRRHLAATLAAAGGSHPTVDIDRCAIGGDSAGGTYATALGHTLQPRPCCIVDVYGNSDWLDPQHWQPKPPEVYQGTHPLREVLAMVAIHDPAQAISDCPYRWELRNIPEAVTQERWARPDFVYSPRVRLQGAMKEFFGQTKTTVMHTLRLGRFGTEKERRAYAESVSPYHILLKAQSYPPVAFLHGDADTAVPIWVAQEFEARLKEMGVDTLAKYAPGAPHVFDMIFTGPEAEGWDEYIVPILDFVEERV